MIFEFALDPALVAHWYDRKKYLFFEEKFGLRTRRLVSAYPKSKWKKMIWEIFSGCPDGSDQNAQMRMTEIVQFLWENAIKRPGNDNKFNSWIDSAEAEHVDRPFHAIISTHNPNNRDYVIAENELLDKGHPKWIVPYANPVKRSAEDLGMALAQPVRLCKQLILIDPYFDPTKDRFRKPLEAILSSFNHNVFGIENLQVELHTSIDRFFESWERHDSRNIEDEKRVYKNMMSDVGKHLPDLIPKGITLKVVMWKQKANGEKLHNRYILTNVCGVLFGTGSDEADCMENEETDDLVLLEEGQYQTRCKQYLSTTPAFDLVGDPVFILGKK